MNIKKIANVVIPIILVSVIGIALYKVITVQMEYQEAEEEYNELAAYIIEVPIESSEQPIQNDIDEVGKEVIQIPEDEGGLDEAQERAPLKEMGIMNIIFIIHLRKNITVRAVCLLTARRRQILVTGIPLYMVII